jgi:hypothetical protein
MSSSFREREKDKSSTVFTKIYFFKNEREARARENKQYAAS